MVITEISPIATPVKETMEVSISSGIETTVIFDRIDSTGPLPEYSEGPVLSTAILFGDDVEPMATKEAAFSFLYSPEVGISTQVMLQFEKSSVGFSKTSGEVTEFPQETIHDSTRKPVDLPASHVEIIASELVSSNIQYDLTETHLGYTVTQTGQEGDSSERVQHQASQGGTVSSVNSEALESVPSFAVSMSILPTPQHHLEPLHRKPRLSTTLKALHL